MTLEDQIVDVMQIYDSHKLISLFRDLLPFFELFDVDDESDWVIDAVGEENAKNVKIIRVVYLLSKLAENHSGTLANIKIKHKNLYRKLEAIANGS